MTQTKEHLQKVNHALRIQISDLERLADNCEMRAKGVRLVQYKELLLMTSRQIREHAKRLEINAFSIMAIIGDWNDEPTDHKKTVLDTSPPNTERGSPFFQTLIAGKIIS